MRRYAALLAMVGVLQLGAAAQAETIVVLDSQPGDWVGGGIPWTFTESNGTFRVFRETERVRVLFDSPTLRSWDLGFLPPSGLPLAPGIYEGAVSFPLNPPSLPAMQVSGYNRGCNSVTGRFTILELALDGRGDVERFAVDFEQHCDGAAPALFGSVRINSTLAIPSPDVDADGRVDAVDNCPAQPNPDQANRDGDAAGDVCDPFPDDADDLQACLAGNDALTAVLDDADSDGEAGSTDACPDTPPGAVVDDAGCSHEQFCGRIDVAAPHGRDACLHADWRNDEPGMRSRDRDCRVQRDVEGRRCVATGE